MRDDIHKLASSNPDLDVGYARRRGLPAMKKQPQSYINMVARATNQPKKGFVNRDASETVKTEADARRTVRRFLDMC